MLLDQQAGWALSSYVWSAMPACVEAEWYMGQAVAHLRGLAILHVTMLHGANLVGRCIEAPYLHDSCRSAPGHACEVLRGQLGAATSWAILQSHVDEGEEDYFMGIPLTLLTRVQPAGRQMETVDPHGILPLSLGSNQQAKC